MRSLVLSRLQRTHSTRADMDGMSRDPPSPAIRICADVMGNLAGRPPPRCCRVFSKLFR